MTDQPQSDGINIARFIGLALIVVGIFWVVFCGLCAINWVAGFLLSGARRSAGTITAIFTLVSLAGGAIGIPIFYLGRRLWTRN